MSHDSLADGLRMSTRQYKRLPEKPASNNGLRSFREAVVSRRFAPMFSCSSLIPPAYSCCASAPIMCPWSKTCWVAASYAGSLAASFIDTHNSFRHCRPLIYLDFERFLCLFNGLLPTSSQSFVYYIVLVNIIQIAN